MPFRVILILLVFISCSTSKNIKTYSVFDNSLKKLSFSEHERSNWQHKDIVNDSIPGISTEKAYLYLKKKKGIPTIVAFIDSELDISHNDLRNQIWTNKNEIPNNAVDDDNNGYTDDIHGWNYLGTKKGDSLPYTSFSYIRYIKKYDSIFKDTSLDRNTLLRDRRLLYEQYLKATEVYDKISIQKKRELKFYNKIDSTYDANNKIIKNFLKTDEYNLDQLDSISKIVTNIDLKVALKKMISYLQNGASKKRITEEKINVINFLEKLLNKQRNDRIFTNDDSNTITDDSYGNNNVQGTYSINHGTKVTSVLAANRNNDEGIKGVFDNVQVMSLNVIAYGDPFDKDIALAIRYAVNNGAKIINLSLSNAFSVHRKWVDDAIRYAAKNDVLIVTSSGNESIDVDTEMNYPNDDDYLNEEFVSNFIKVGASTFYADKRLVSDISNYGKRQVDIFAPGENIMTLKRNGFQFVNGTSYSAPIVSGVAALIRSHYPNLTAAEVKQIIMESGVSYDIMVNKPSTSKEKELVPFSSLSKSGKIVNAYNALLMAEEVSKKKKKKKRK